jgi:hypothetical protein
MTLDTPIKLLKPPNPVPSFKEDFPLSITKTMNLPYLFDSMTFPLLQSIAAATDTRERIAELGPSDVDRLGNEVSGAFKRCSVSESTIPVAEREVNEVMLACIGNIDSCLSGALQMLFRRTVATPDNLKALFRMADPDIRTGMVRIHAIWHLCMLTSLRSIWDIQLKNVVSGETGSSNSVAFHMIRAMALALSITPYLDATSTLNSTRGPLSNSRAWVSLGEALGICQDEPEMVMDLLMRFDWPSIFKRSDCHITDNPGDRSFWDSVLFVRLHLWPVRRLVQDPNDETAKQFLKKQKGSCVELFHRILRRIISGEIWSQGANSSRFEDLGPVGIFLMDFMNCLAPLPCDRETDALVRRARSSLLESHMTSLLSEVMVLAQSPESAQTHISHMEHVLELMDEDGYWKELKKESPSNKWLRFSRLYLQGGRVDYQKIAKSIKKANQKSVKKDLTEGEMCACCFVLESNLQCKLLKCSRCRQIKYCSGECQKEHWKKAHKKQCKKATAD